MKRIYILFILSIISFIFMIFCFLALNDISHDYLSKKVLISENILENNDLGKIPKWTDCKSEWYILQIDFIIRVVFMIFFIIMIIKLIRDYKKK